MIAQEKIPLTAGQKIQLAAQSLLIGVFAVLFVILILLTWRVAFETPLMVLLTLFEVLTLLSIAYQVQKPLRDLFSGVALIELDVLKSSQVSHSRSGRSFWGQFERLGKMRLPPQVYTRSQSERSYRVVYSPASKIVWQLEPVN